MVMKLLRLASNSNFIKTKILPTKSKYQRYGKRPKQNNPIKSIRIVDICAGTGLVAKPLKPSGYVNIDAHDGIVEMIESAKQQNLYNKYYVEMIIADMTMPIPEETYYAAIMSGASALGHLNSSHIPILLTLLKTGGRFLITAREASMTETKHEGKTALEYLDELEQNNVLKVLEKQVVSNYFSGEPGMALAYEKL